MCVRLEELGSQFLAMPSDARIVRAHGLEDLEVPCTLGLVRLDVRQEVGQFGIEVVVRHERLLLDRSIGGWHEERRCLRTLRQELVDEFLDEVLGITAGETIDGPALVDRHDHRDRLRAECLRDGRVLVHVHLGEHDLAAGCTNDLLQDRTERLARATPRSPQVHDDRSGLRRVDDLGLERGVGDVDDHGGHDIAECVSERSPD